MVSAIEDVQATNASQLAGNIIAHLTAMQAAAPDSPEYQQAQAKLSAAISASTGISQTNGVLPRSNVTTMLPNSSPKGSQNYTLMPSTTVSASNAISYSSAAQKLNLPGSGPLMPNFNYTQPARPKGDDDPIPASSEALSADQPTTLSTTTPSGMSVVREPSSTKMSITGLGAQLISSSLTPVAGVEPPRAPVLSKTMDAQTLAQVTGSASKLANETKPLYVQPIATIQVDATAPSQQDHSKLWSQAIEAAKTPSTLTWIGSTMSNLGLASIGADGSLVKMAIAQALNTSPDKSVQVEKAAAPAALSSSSAIAAVADAAAQVPTIPSVAQKPTDTESVPLPAAISALQQNALQQNADPTANTPNGFVLSGNMKLFGTIEAERFVYQGTASDGKAEMVTLVQQPVALDDIFQGSGVSFGKVMLTKPSLSYYDGTVSDKPSKGLWLDAGILLGDVCPDVSEDANTFFGQSQADQLAVTIGLGNYSSWSAALKPPTDLTIKASLPNVSGKVGKRLTFTSASVTLVATKPTTASTSGAKPTYSWDVTFTGTLLFSAPNSIAPLHLEFTMKKVDKLYNLEVRMNKNDKWTTAMGVPGMNLTNVVILAKFDSAGNDSSSVPSTNTTDVITSTAPKDAKKNPLEFRIDASIESSTRALDVHGTFADDVFELSAEMDGYTWQNVDDLFHQMFGSPLQQTKHNITFTKLTLNASSKDQDVKLTGQVNIDDWVPEVTCDIDFSSKGLTLNAEIPQIHCDELLIVENAKLALFVGKKGDVDPSPRTAGTATYFRIDGTLVFHGMELDAGAHFDKDETNKPIWALYAQLKPESLAKSHAFNLSNLYGTGKRSDLNLSLGNFSVTASNTDTLGDLMPQDLPYKVKQGKHLFAEIDCPTAVSKAMNMKPGSVTLEVDLDPAQKIVKLVFDTPQKLSLKPGMMSTEVDVGINFSTPEPKLFVSASIDVQFSSQPVVSTFEFELTADLTEAEIFGQMKTDWVNPFNLGPQVKILSPELGADIIYVSPLYPSGLSFGGGLQVGSFKGEAKFKVTTNPKEGVLIVELKDLGIKDIISFASLIIDHAIPQPKNDFLELKQLKLSASTGASLGDVYYPAGVAYDAQIQLFGKNADIKAEITKEEMHLYGEVDAFTLGPMQVAGNTGKNPTVDLVVSEKLQELQVNGNIRLWEIDAGVTITAGLEPLNLDFETQLVFGELLDFKLHADVVGQVDNFKDLMKSDFTFSASLEQHVLDYFMAHANTYVLAAKKGAEESITSAEDHLNAAKKSYEDYLNKQQAVVDDAKMKWDRQNQSVVAAANAKKAQIKAQTAAKQADVDAAKAKLDEFIGSLQKKLQDSKATEAAEVAKAQATVNAAKAKADKDVNDKVTRLQQAQASLAKSFGNADSTLESVRAKVQIAQNEFNGSQQKLNNARSDLSHASFFNKLQYALQVAEYGTELALKETALKVAQEVLVAAEAVVNGVGYKMAHEAVSIAEAALEDAKKVADVALNDANKTLAESQKIQAGLVEESSKALSEAQKECDQSKAWDAAKALLKTAMDVEANVVADAEKTVAALASCIEKVAYDAASTALALAKAGTKEVDLANSALEIAKHSVEEVAAMSGWLINHVGNIFNIRSVQLSGSLGEATKGSPLKAHIEGEFCDKTIKIDVDFIPGKAEDMMKATFEKIMSDMKGNISTFVKDVAKKV